MTYDPQEAALALEKGQSPFLGTGCMPRRTANFPYPKIGPVLILVHPVKRPEPSLKFPTLPHPRGNLRRLKERVWPFPWVGAQRWWTANFPYAEDWFRPHLCLAHRAPTSIIDLSCAPFPANIHDTACLLSMATPRPCLPWPRSPDKDSGDKSGKLVRAPPVKQ